MHRLADILPDALGVALLVRRAGAWVPVKMSGQVDVFWAISLLDLGQREPLGDAADPRDYVEVVVQRDDLHVMIGDGHQTVVARLDKGGNVGMALGYLRQLRQTTPTP